MTASHTDASSSEGPDRSGTIIDERYELLRLLGTGSMSTVYEARQIRLNKPVAIKILRPELAYNTAHVSKFLQHARAASLIRHPNVVDISDFGEYERAPYLVMEFLEGLSLQELVDTSGPLPWEHAMGVLKQIALALEAAHLEGVLHRDVKPSNCFLLSPRDPDREAYFVKVMDFGMTSTPHYTAPEVATLGKNDVRSDIYSLGVLAYQTLTGTLPFDGPTTFSILAQHRDTAPKPLREHDLLVPAEVERWVLRAMAKKPEDRFASMREAREALRELDPSASTASSTNMVLADTSGSTHFRPASVSGLHARVSTSRAPLPSRRAPRTSILRRSLENPILVAACSAAIVAGLGYGALSLYLPPHDATREEGEMRAMTTAQMLEEPATRPTIIVLPPPLPSPPEAPVAAPPSGEPAMVGHLSPEATEPSHETLGPTPSQRSRRAAVARASVAPAAVSPAAVADALTSEDTVHHDADLALPPQAPEPKPRRRSTPPPSRPSVADDDPCIVPFEVDARGHKRFKRQCL